MRYFIVIVFLFLLAGREEARGQVHIPDSIKYRSLQYHYQRLLGISRPKALDLARVQGANMDSLTALYGRFERFSGERLLHIRQLDSLTATKVMALLSVEEYQRFRKLKRVR